jgi:mono/diheme cytochrome c family protein
VPLGADGEADPTLLLGREIYGNRCASCHSSDGGGRNGPRLNSGRVIERYPDPAEQLAFVAAGRGGMPGFGDDFSPEQLEAVVAYTREVLVDVG